MKRNARNFFPVFVALSGWTIVAAAPLVGQDTRDARLAVLAGIADWDLSGTGTDAAVAARVDFPITDVFLLEAGVGAFFPDQQGGTDGETDTVVLTPEVQIQVQKPGKFSPYFGLGGGWAIDSRGKDLDSEREFTASAALGVRIGVTRRTGLRFEARLRGIGENFSGSAGEFTAGLSWGL